MSKDRQAIKLLVEQKVQNEFLFTCDDEEFMEKFRVVLEEFYNRHDGKIEVNRIPEHSPVRRQVIVKVK